MTEPQMVEALVIHPGDSVLVRIPSDISVEAATKFRKQLEARHPEVAWTIVTAEQIAVIRS